MPSEAAACSHSLMMPRKMVVFLMDSILYKVELRKGNRKMNNKNMGVIKWADLFFGLREKRGWRRKNVVSVV